MQWKFRPQQTEVLLVPGETSLAFYTATNPTSEAIVGISTYNVVPFDVCSLCGGAVSQLLTVGCYFVGLFFCRRRANTLTKSSASASRSSG